jgi:CBS domain-containing protein
MKVRELMTANVDACRPHDSLNRAAQLMWENDCGAVPVIDEDWRVIGIVTDRDICMAAYTQGRPIAESRVDTAMARGAVTCSGEDEVTHAAKLMREHQVRRLPVIDNDRLIGMISLSDLARQAERERVSKTKKRAIRESEVVATFGAVVVPNPPAIESAA